MVRPGPHPGGRAVEVGGIEGLSQRNSGLREAAPPFLHKRRKGWATPRRFGGSRGGPPSIAVAERFRPSLLGGGPLCFGQEAESLRKGAISIVSVCRIYQVLDPNRLTFDLILRVARCCVRFA